MGGHTESELPRDVGVPQQAKPRRRTAALTREEKVAAIGAVPFWYHSIDVGDGLVTPGKWSLQRLQRKFEQFAVPDLHGKSVIDIGCWDGFNAFEAERRGARRVVAMDRPVWSTQIDRPELIARFKESVRSLEAVPNYYKPGEMPGKVGFDTAHRCIQSRVEQHVGDIRDVDVGDLGAFDVVLFIGVLYHLTDPYGTLRKLAALTRELAVIETEGIDIPALEHGAYAEFFGGNELNNDPNNWWALNDRALVEMCKAAGFRDARIVAKNPGQPSRDPDAPNYVRQIAHAWH